MALSKDDLAKIRVEFDKSLDKGLKPVIQRLDKIEKRLEAIEEWLPVNNTFLIKRVEQKAQARQGM